MNLYSKILMGLLTDRMRVGFIADNESHPLKMLRTLSASIGSLAINATIIKIINLLIALAIFNLGGNDHRPLQCQI